MGKKPHEDGQKKNFTPIDNWIFEETRLTPGAKMLLFLLVRFDNAEHKFAWPSKERLARMMGLKQARSVDTYRRELEDLGWIKTFKFTPPGRASRRYGYILLYPKQAVRDGLEDALERPLEDALERTFESADMNTFKGVPDRAQQVLREKNQQTNTISRTSAKAAQAGVEDGQKTATKAGSDESVTRSLTATPSLGAAPIGSGFSAGGDESGPPDSEAASTAVPRGISPGAPAAEIMAKHGLLPSPKTKGKR